MNNEQTIEAIKVMQAYADGIEIQWAYIGEKWSDYVNAEPSWDFHSIAYRIKPLEVWGILSLGRVSDVFKTEKDAIANATNIGRVVKLVEAT